MLLIHSQVFELVLVLHLLHLHLRLHHRLCLIKFYKECSDNRPISLYSIHRTMNHQMTMMMKYVIDLFVHLWENNRERLVHVFSFLSIFSLFLKEFRRFVQRLLELIHLFHRMEVNEDEFWLLNSRWSSKTNWKIWQNQKEKFVRYFFIIFNINIDHSSFWTFSCWLKIKSIRIVIITLH